MKETNFQSHGGLTLVEVIIATSIILIFLLALFPINNLYLNTVSTNTNSVKATLLAEESLEAVRFLRDASWSDNIAPLSVGIGYSLELVSGSWAATTTNIYIDNTFERVVTFLEVYRDINADIVPSGGTLDPNTRLVTASISWKYGLATSTKSVSTYITNILDN